MLDTWRIGETKRLNHVVSGDEAFTVASATIRIYSSAAAVVVTDAACTIDPAGSDTEHEVYYAWTPDTAGDYTYLLKYVVGSQTIGIHGTAFVLPVTSKYDRWVASAFRKTQEAPVGEDQQSLSYRDYMEAVDAARRRYQRDWPQRKLNHADGVVMTSAWEYALPADWVDGFSQIIQFEYPVDSTVQARPFLDSSFYYIDALRLKWAFRDYAPLAGEFTRYVYTTEHTLSHTADTLPAHHFDAIALYAAGEAMEMLANEATRTDARSVAAEVANFRTKQQERRSQAGQMKRQAVEAWANPVWSL